MIVLSIILGLMVVVLGYTTFNLLKKNEKAEDLILNYENYVRTLAVTLSAADKKIKDIDSKGLFDSDDEVGWFFNHIKEVQDDLNKFNPNL